MSMTTAINAAPGPAAPEFVYPRVPATVGPATVGPGVVGPGVVGPGVVGSEAHIPSDPVRDSSPAKAPVPVRVGAADAHREGPRSEKSDRSERAGHAATVNPTFQYDTKAQRMVMLMHDQGSGAVVQQIPSEMALRQYEDAVRRVREDAAAVQVTAARPSSFEAASLGVILPAVAAGSAPPEPAPPQPVAPGAAAPGAAGSVTAGAGSGSGSGSGATGGGARFTTVV